MNSLTINDILRWDEKNLIGSQRADFEALEGMALIRKTIEKRKTSGLWRHTQELALSRVEDLLDISLADVFRRAWNKSVELKRFRDQEKYPPNKTFIVPLVEHKIHSHHRPYLEISLNQQLIGRLDFDVQLEMALKGIRLHIKNGRIQKSDIGEIHGKGALYCEGFLLVQRETEKIEIPGKIDLGQGIEI